MFSAAPFKNSSPTYLSSSEYPLFSECTISTSTTRLVILLHRSSSSAFFLREKKFRVESLLPSPLR